MRKYLVVAVLILCCVFAKAQTKDAVTPNNNQAFQSTEHAATYPGGTEKLYSFISANIKYPEAAKKANAQGKVILRFVIDTNGAITDVKIIQGVTAEINAEAVRLIKSTANWIPGTQNGKPVRMSYTLPITFALKTLN